MSDPNLQFIEPECDDDVLVVTGPTDEEIDVDDEDAAVAPVATEPEDEVHE